MKIFSLYFSIMIVMLAIWVEVGTAQTPPTLSDWMPDTNLQTVVLSKLQSIDSNITEITQTHMANSSFTSLTATNKGITNITGMEYATNLTSLRLDKNSITTIPDLSALTSLTSLRLDNNSISAIPTTLPTSLTTLNLNNTSSGEELGLANNSISDISAVSSLTSLTTLLLASNSITTIPDLSALTSLSILNLNKNSISGAIPTTLPTSLTKLYLRENSISDISGVSSLSSLTHLYANDNSISALPTLPTSLQEIRISNTTLGAESGLANNSISTIPDLSSLSSLRILYLYRNNITAIPTTLPANLQQLDLFGNSITTIPNLSSLTRLQNLWLDNNNISDISALANLNTLSYLSLHLGLGNNNISDISVLANLQNKKLVSLYLSGNEISDFSVVSSLINLTSLYLIGSKITTTEFLLPLTKLITLEMAGHRITDVEELQKLAALRLPPNGNGKLQYLSLKSSGESYYVSLSILDDPEALRACLYVPPSPAALTVTFAGYPEDRPTDEFTLTIRFPEPVTGFEKKNITVETELKRGTGTATLEALTPIGGTRQTNDEGEVEVLAQTYVARIKLPPNASGTVKLIVHPGAATSASGRIVPTTAIASEPIAFGRKGPLVFPSHVAMDKVIFNEFRNAEDDTHDWIELKNISDEAVALKEWEISIVAAEDEPHYVDRDIVAFPDYTLPAGGILLILNTDPSETDLLRGQNLENPDHNPKLRPLSLIRPEMKLPNTPFLLILRDARNKNGTWGGFEDLAGDYHRGDVNYRTQVWPLRDTWVYTGTEARFSQAEVYQRVMRPRGAIPMKPMARGYLRDAWVLSDYQAGLGYDPSASPETGLGTPGYATTLMADDVGTGQISFSEVMYATNERGSVSQWIELYNNSAAEIVDLEGWRLIIEVRDSQPVHRHTTFHFKSLEVMPNQTALLVTQNDRNSENIPVRRIYNVKRENRKALVLRAEGFALRLFSSDGTLVDMAGNLDGRVGEDKPRWELPSGWSESGARSSLIRAYEERVPWQGTVPGSWVRAVETALIGPYTYWGLETDNGTPGYRQGSPLPVTLSSFRADLREGSVVVNWTTASEMENAGFNILRSETKKGDFVKVNPTLILGAGTTAEQNTYTYTDTTAKSKVAYYYQIEEVSLSGDRRPLTTVRMRGHLSAAGKLLGTWGALRVVD